MRTALPTNRMIIVPDSMATPNGLTFTIGQITWTTGSNNFIAMNTEEVQIQSAPTTIPPASVTAPIALGLTPVTPALSSATSTTRRPLPCYKGKQIDDTDLLDSINRVGTKLAETLTLVDSIQNQSTKQVTVDHNRSTRPARASRRARLGTDLVVTTTPEGRSVRHQSVPATGLRLFEYEALMENYQVQPPVTPTKSRSGLHDQSASRDELIRLRDLHIPYKQDLQSSMQANYRMHSRMYTLTFSNESMRSTRSKS